MVQLSKGLIYLGIFLVLIGLLGWGLIKAGVPLGKLPGDIHVEKGKSGLYFPIVTCIVISILLTILVNVLLWVFRK